MNTSKSALPSPVPHAPITGFILAGGKSRRMGQDKGLLELNGAYLVYYAIRVLRRLTDNVWIVGDPKKYAFLGLPVIRDCTESKGPLTGIYTALRASQTLFNLVLACDMPLMKPEFFKLLLKKASQVDAVLMRFEDGFLEPLCSIYASTCLRPIEQSFKQQKYKMSDFIGRIKVHYISEIEIARLGLDRLIFTNVNTPEEFKQLSSKLQPL